MLEVSFRRIFVAFATIDGRQLLSMRQIFQACMAIKAGTAVVNASREVLGADRRNFILGLGVAHGAVLVTE
jgi:hypothetical protein